MFDANSGQWFSRAQLATCISKFAQRLRFGRKSLGFVYAFNDSQSLISYLSSLQAGHAVVMLNPELDDQWKAALIATFRPDFMVAPAWRPPPAAAQGPEYDVEPIQDLGLLLLRSRFPERAAIHPDLALLISTSGSTGSPKLVRLSWTNLASNARQINHALSHHESDRTMITAPIFNGYGQSVIHTMLLAGGSFALTRARIVTREFWDAVRGAGCNVIGGTPYFYEVLDRLDLDTLAVPELRRFVQVGGRLPAHLVSKFHSMARNRGGALHLMYGQAEATARISGLPPEYLPEASGSIGFVLSGGRLWVERRGRECAPMEEGELTYEGPNVMMGYASRREDLAKGPELGRLSTGDLGYRDSQGLFYITGRRSRFVKLNGWRVSLDEVEALLSHAGPVAAVNLQDRIIIYAESSGGITAGSVEQLAARLRLHPSGFELRCVNAIPRLANGKVDYRSLAGDVPSAAARPEASPPAGRKAFRASGTACS